MTFHATARALSVFGVCAPTAVCTLYVTKSTAQSPKADQPQAGSEASPIYGVTIPAGYRDWHLISVGNLVGGSLNPGGGNLRQLRAQLSNDIAIKAFREGKLPFPDGAVIAALHWDEVSSEGNNNVSAIEFPGAGLQSSYAGSAENVQSRTQKSTPQRVAGGSPTSRTGNPAMRRYTKRASHATRLPRIGILSSRVTRQRPEL